MTDSQTVMLSPPASSLSGTVVPPGSKSITNRALLVAALAKGTSTLAGALKSDDTKYMAEALRLMGVSVTEPNETTFVVTSSGKLKQPSEALFLGNAGTAVRFLTAAVNTVCGEVVLNGDSYMQKRPIAPLVSALNAAGLEVQCPTGCPPVVVKSSGALDVERFEIDGNLSSQYVSALLMLAACGTRSVEVVLTGEDIGAMGYIDLTIACMRRFGAVVTAVGSQTWRVEATGYSATDYLVEPDASAATYLWGAEALTGGAISLGVDADEFTQPDAKAKYYIGQYPRMQEVINGSQMQDAIPTLAVIAAFNQNPVRFIGIENLRVKECDRIQALHDGLNAIKPGLASIEGDDLIVHADPELKVTNAVIDTHADHRMAMAFALAGLKVQGVRIQDPDCVAKTYPGYWEAMAGLGVQVSRGDSR